MTAVKIGRHGGRGVILVFGPTADEVADLAEAGGPPVRLVLESALHGTAEALSKAMKFSDLLRRLRRRVRQRSPGKRTRGPGGRTEGG